MYDERRNQPHMGRTLLILINVKKAEEPWNPWADGLGAELKTSPILEALTLPRQNGRDLQMVVIFTGIVRLHFFSNR
jgi:hypothetical protein